MKLIITSDWHIDATTAGKERLLDIGQAIDEVCRLAIDEKVDEFLFLGDLHDPDSPEWIKYQSLLLDIQKQLQSKKIVQRWLVGNHDCFKSGQWNTLDLISDKTNVYSTPCTEHDSKYNWVWLPYVWKYDPNWNWQTFFTNITNRKKKTLIFSHMQIEGVTKGSESTTFARGRDHILPTKLIKEYCHEPIVFQGHYHKKQEIVRDGVPIHIVGSLVNIHFDEEENQPGCMIVTV